GGGQGRRDKIVLATKLYGGKGEWPNDSLLSAVNIRRSCEASLRRLGTDRIDLYQMHHVDRATPWEEIWEALAVLRAQGKIIYAGSSNCAGWHIAQAQEAARRHGAFGLVSEQSLYNLAVRTVELEVLPACQGYGLGVLPWSPLHGGLLGGILRKQPGAGRSGGGRAGDAPARPRPPGGADQAVCAEACPEPAGVGPGGAGAPARGHRADRGAEPPRAARRGTARAGDQAGQRRAGPAGRDLPRSRRRRARGLRVVSPRPPAGQVSSSPSRLRSSRRSESSRAASAPVWSCSATQSSSAHS